MIAEPRTHHDPDPQSPAAEQPSARHAALTAAVANIRVRRFGAVPVEQILLAAAAILFPLGLVFILLGWDGAAHTGRTYAQIDYLISGGLFGLGLSVAGGFMYFGYWLSRQLSEARRQNTLTVEALQRLEELLEAAVMPRMSTNGHAPRPTSATTATTAKSDSDRPTGEMPTAGPPMLYATPKGTLLHLPDCPVVARRADLKAVPAGTDGYGYCTICNAADVLAVSPSRLDRPESQ